MKKNALVAILGLMLVFTYVAMAETSVSPSPPNTQNTSLTINPGWNLIPGGFGLYTGSENPRGCSSNFYTAIYAYSPLENKYVGGTPPKSTSYNYSLYKPYVENNENYYMIPGNAGTSIWAYSTTSCEIKIDGGINPGIPEVSLYKGWNFISITGRMYGLTPNIIFQNCQLQKAYYWDSSTQSWIKGDLTNNQQVTWTDLGQGRLIKVAAECKLSAAPTTPLPPLPE